MQKNKGPSRNETLAFTSTKDPNGPSSSKYHLVTKSILGLKGILVSINGKKDANPTHTSCKAFIIVKEPSLLRKAVTITIKNDRMDTPIHHQVESKCK